jgi:AcrR family transcriptional regulator
MRTVPTFALALDTPSPAQTRLIDACEFLIARRGFAGVTLTDIRRHAGHGNHAAIRYHFGSRDELVRATYDWRSRPLHGDRARRVAELDAGGKGADVAALMTIWVETLSARLDALRPSSFARFQVALLADRPFAYLDQLDADLAEAEAGPSGGVRDDGPYPMHATNDLNRRIAVTLEQNGAADGALVTSSALRAAGALFAAWEVDVEVAGDDAVPLDAVTAHALRASLGIVAPHR